MDKHTITIPTYNEGENPGLLVEETLDLRVESQVIIVDGNSPDGTVELANELAAQHPSVRIVHRPGRLGLGTAHFAGMKAVVAGGARILPGGGTLQCSIPRKALSQGADLFARTPLSLQARTCGGVDGLPLLRCC